jgi:hypothetical protein
MNDFVLPLRPKPDEYVDFYETYVSAVPDGDIVQILRDYGVDAEKFFDAIPDDKVDYRYAPDKWSTKEVIGHIVDTERLFSYRTFRFARGDQTPLAGLDQDVIMRGADFEKRDIGNLRDEFHHLRASNIALCENFDGAVLSRRGTASDCVFTVRASLYIIAGHAIHHTNVLRDLYL